MARERNYNWSPQQMARVNARREARGQEALVNKKFADPDYAEKYIDEAEAYSTRKQRGPSTLPKAGEPPTSSLKTAEDRSADFRKRFEARLSGGSLGRPSMAPSTRAIEEEEFRKKTGRGAKGVSTPSIKGSMDRVMGLV